MPAIISLTEKIRFIEAVFGVGKLSRDAKNFDIRCPICVAAEPKLARDKRKLSIHVDDDAWHCWACGAKGHTLWPLIRKSGTRDQLLDYRDRFMPDDKRSHRCLDLTVVEPEKLKLPNDFKLIVTSSLRDPDALALRKYLAQRKVSERDMWYFKLGYSNEFRWKRRVLMPSFDAQGDLTYFVGRAIDKFRRPKYDGPDTASGYKLGIVFNELNIDWTQELVIVEGPFDLMKCPDNAVPLLGSNLNDTSALFNAIIAHSTPVALALDADMRVKKTPRVAKKLAEYDVPVRIVRVPGDPGEMTKQEFKQCLDAAKPFSWGDAFFDKLDFVTGTALVR